MEQLTASDRSDLPTAGTDSSRPAAPTRRPSLLPAFEPVASSSPPIANTLKRKHDSLFQGGRLYPTPVPTSSTGVLPSSPPRRPALSRTQSNVTERNPLADVPTVDIPTNGEPVLIGRSGASCHFKLPYNKLVSRVHVKVQYIGPDATNAYGQVAIECLGWNGATVRCGGREHALRKGDTFKSNQPGAEIILDIQDTRVILAWPDEDVVRHNGLEEDSSPERGSVSRSRNRFGSSPPPLFPQSPVSPSPARHAAAPPLTSTPTRTAVTTSTETVVQVYEDPNSDHLHEEEISLSPSRPTHSRQLSGNGEHKAAMSQESILSSVPEDLSEEENEENDPIVFSFGPLGANILSRMNSVTTAANTKSPQHSHSQTRRRSSLMASPRPASKRGSDFSPYSESLSSALGRSKPTRNESPIKNHVINQLAFSRLHSMPLSTIHSNLPAELKAAAASFEKSKANGGDQEELEDADAALTDADLKQLLEAIPCVGEITRSGKDAAGKQLENEYYYVPEMDDNAMRRDTVKASMGSTSLRAVRKNHKVCMTTIENSVEGLLTSHCSSTSGSVPVTRGVLCGPSSRCGAEGRRRRRDGRALSSSWLPAPIIIVA